MTLIKAAEKALEALEYALPFDGANGGIGGAIADLNAAIEAAKRQDGWVLREVLFDDGEPIAHREPAQPAPVQEPVLQEIEQYQLQMAGISTAAIGYWKEGDGIHPDYDTPALRDVAKLYAKYDAIYTAAKRQPLTDEKRRKLMSEAWNKWLSKKDDGRLFAWDFSFEVEAAHGIKEKSNGN